MGSQLTLSSQLSTTSRVRVDPTAGIHPSFVHSAQKFPRPIRVKSHLWPANLYRKASFSGHGFEGLCAVGPGQ